MTLAKTKASEYINQVSVFTGEILSQNGVRVPPFVNLIVVVDELRKTGCLHGINISHGRSVFNHILSGRMNAWFRRPPVCFRKEIMLLTFRDNTTGALQVKRFICDLAVIR